MTFMPATPPAPTPPTPQGGWQNLAITGLSVAVVGLSGALWTGHKAEFHELKEAVIANADHISDLVQVSQANTTRSIDNSGEIQRLWDRVLGR